MAASRSHGPLLEQSRRPVVRLALIAAGLVLVALGAAFALRPEAPDRIAGHAFAIPTATGEDRIVVEVLNATSRSGLARTATRLLRRQGVDVVFFGNARAPLDSSRVVVRRGGVEPGHAVARALGLTRVVTEPDTLRRVDVTVLLGGDYVPAGPLHP